MIFSFLILDIVQDTTVLASNFYESTAPESGETNWIIVVAAILVFAAILFYFFKKNKRSSFPKSLPIIKQVDRRKVNGILVFEDIVGWFKTIDNLDKEVDTPFIADANKFKDVLGPSSSKIPIVIGVYNEKEDEITHHLLLEADEIDDKTREVLGSEPLVVLN